MRAAVMEHLPQATVVVGAAAVADFRMAAVSAEKLRREGGAASGARADRGHSARGVAAAHRPGTLVIAFAAEMDASMERAREKLLAKGADAIVLNDVSQAGIGFDSDRNAATFDYARKSGGDSRDDQARDGRPDSRPGGRAARSGGPREEVEVSQGWAWWCRRRRECRWASAR